MSTNITTTTRVVVHETNLRELPGKYHHVSRFSRIRFLRDIFRVRFEQLIFPRLNNLRGGRQRGGNNSAAQRGLINFRGYLTLSQNFLVRFQDRGFLRVCFPVVFVVLLLLPRRHSFFF